MIKPTMPSDLSRSDPMQMAFTEIGSAVSCLHMPSEPIFGPFQDACGPEGYIVNNEYWAKHANEHIAAAKQWLLQADQEINQLKAKIYRLERNVS